jgi:hypothetical protein
METELMKENTEIQPENQGLWKTSVIYGLYYALVSIALTVVFYATGNMTSTVFQGLGIVVMIAAIVIIQISYRKSLGGWMTYGQGLSIGLVSMVAGSVIVAIFTFILYKFIDPELIAQIKLMTEEKFYQQGMSDEQIRATMAFTEKFQTPAIISFMTIVNFAIMGLIISAITAIFTKKQSPDPFSN